MEAQQDDGSLAFLGIAPDKNNRHFSCAEVTQQKLTNTTFYVVDYVENIKTKYGENRFLVSCDLLAFFEILW